MAEQEGFGAVLRDMRQKKGMKLTLVARRLRIRPDVLEAIERSDFDAMPPRGYTRNMVNAYARFLGLNATDITKMYLEEYQKHQRLNIPVNQGPQRVITMEDAPVSPFGTASRGRKGISERTNQASRFERLYSPSDLASYKRRSSGAQSYAARSYGTPPEKTPIQARTPFYVALGIIAMLILIILILLFLPHNDQPNNQEVVPVTGLEDKGDTSPEQLKNETVEVSAPEKTVVKLEVESGKSAYIEVYEEGADNPSIASEIAGPKTETFDVKKNILIVTTNPAAVTVTQDGEKVELKDNNGNGVYKVRIKFADVLKKWNKEHPDDKVKIDDEESDRRSSNESDNSDEEANSNQGQTRRASRSNDAQENVDTQQQGAEDVQDSQIDDQPEDEAE